MKVKRRSMVVAALILIFFTVLPLASPMLIPQELFTALYVEARIDLASILFRVAVIGLAMAVLVLLRGIVEKNSQAGLALSIINKVFWFIIVLFAVGVGKIENVGLTVLGGGNNSNTNIVVFDLRLIVFLVAIIMTLMVVRSIFEYQEAKPKPETLNITQPQENSKSN
jgi:hypothetical protein